MTTPTPSNPLDKFLFPTSDNWLPNRKPPHLGSLGEPLKNPDITYRPLLLRLKQYSKPIDIVAHRQLLRTRLLNSKAQALDRIINDDIDANQAELAYIKRINELKRLEQEFANGLFSFFVDGVKQRASEAIQTDYFANDDDVSSFDRETGELLEGTQRINELNQQIEELQKRQIELSGTIEQLLREKVETATTEAEVEGYTELAEARKELTQNISQEETTTEEQTGDLEPQELQPPPTTEMLAEEIKSKEQSAEKQAEDAEQLETIKEKLRKITKPETKAKARVLGEQLKDLAKQVRAYQARAKVELPKTSEALLKGIEKIKVEELERPTAVEKKAGLLKGIMKELEIRTSSQKAKPRELEKQAGRGEMMTLRRSITPEAERRPAQREAGAGNF